MKRLFLLLALCGMVAVGCTEGGPDDNINNGGGNNTEQPGGETDEESIEVPSNEIWYTSTNNLELLPASTKMHIFGANLTSNIYKDGKGVLTFDALLIKSVMAHSKVVGLLPLSLSPIVLPKLAMEHSTLVSRSRVSLSPRGLPRLVTMPLLSATSPPKNLLITLHWIPLTMDIGEHGCVR